MFTTIIVATDLSPASDQLIACLGGWRGLGTRDAVLVHALGFAHAERVPYPLDHWAESRLAAQRAALENLGYATSARTLPGIPEIEINRIAREFSDAMIAVGSHGATLAREVLIGGVAMAVLHRATTPVFVLPLQPAADGPGAECVSGCGDFARHLLFPTDFSDTSEHAFSVVERMAESGARHITLVHVQDVSRIHPHLSERLDEFNRIDSERLERHRDALLKRGANRVETELTTGHPLREILRVTRAREVSAIVMGSQGRGFIEEVFLGSVSHQVARNSPVPVLFIPAARA